MKKAIVTGATGFLGSLLSERLLADGYAVTGIARSRPGSLTEKTLSHMHFRLLNADLTSADIPTDLPEDVDIVFHMAGAKPGNPDTNFSDFYRGNVQATIGALELALSTNARQFVLSSTFSIFGVPPAEEKITETSEAIPTNAYGITKLISERVVELGLKGSACHSAIVRFPSIFGERLDDGLVPTYFSRASTSAPIEVFGQGKWFRNLLYAGDAIDLLTRIPDSAGSLPSHQILNYGSADSMQLVEVARLIKHLTGSDSEVRPIAANGSTGWDVWIDTEAAQRLLHIKPRTINEGINQYVKEMINAV